MSERSTPLAEALDAAGGIAARLRESLEDLSPLMPLTLDRLATLGRRERTDLDAFLKRFESLQDSLADQVFRGIVVAELQDAKVQTMRDVLNLMEKLGVLGDVAEWMELRRVRNRLAHEYPRAPALQVKALNDAWDLAPRLLAVLAQAETVVARRGLVR